MRHTLITYTVYNIHTVPEEFTIFLMIFMRQTCKFLRFIVFLFTNYLHDV